MKQYGMNKATEITKKQVGVIYGKAKTGALKVEKWFISELYDLADFYGMDTNRSAEMAETEAKTILEAVFENDLATAQKRIDRIAEMWYSRFSRKKQETCNRAEFVA